MKNNLKIPARLFGQNVEPTRAAVQGGLSAQLVRNRKFAGKPGLTGIAAMWEGYGAHATYTLLTTGCTRHAAPSRMFRRNEIASQAVCCLENGGEAGIRQGAIGLRGGVAHTLKAVVRPLRLGETVPMVLRIRVDGAALAERVFAVSASSEGEWTRISLDVTPERDSWASVEVGVKGPAHGVVGAVSLLPADHFRGMRADVVEHLREIGTSVIRWPGGNFAGEYRWRDGLMADPDERAPLQSYMEIETHPYSVGYDQNDIGQEDILALCEKIGAEPFFTVNPVWDDPEESAEWVRSCGGHVKFWSLGNEPGYGHMEGPNDPEGYAALARRHAEAMLRADPGLQLVSGGCYPYGDEPWRDECAKVWAERSAKALADIAPCTSYHFYDRPDPFDFTTPELTAVLYAQVSGFAAQALGRLRRFRRLLPSGIGISCDEWNLWDAWCREPGVVEGLYVAATLEMFVRHWEELDLRYACYYQPVNEKAIEVDPFGSRLTSAGEAMRLWSRHAGRVSAEIPGIARGAFASDGDDGSRYVTLFNDSPTEKRLFRVPTGGRDTIAASEMLVPSGLGSGSRYGRGPADAVVSGGFCEVRLPPASQVAVRLAGGEST